MFPGQQEVECPNGLDLSARSALTAGYESDRLMVVVGYDRRHTLGSGEPVYANCEVAAASQLLLATRNSGEVDSVILRTAAGS